MVASVPGRFSTTKRIYGMLRMQKLLEDFKIQVNPPICVYPTIENVLKSYEGLMAGGSLPYSDTTHEKQKYLENFL